MHASIRGKNQIGKLPPGSLVHVCEFQGNRVKLDKPLNGWLSIITEDGDVALEAAAPPSSVTFNLTSRERWRLIGYFPKTRLHLKLIKEVIPPKELSKVDAVPILKAGTTMMRFGKRPKPHFRYVQLSPDMTDLLWFSTNKYMDNASVHIDKITHILQGQTTQNFKKKKLESLSPCSFSVIYGDNKSLDLVAKSSDEATLWIYALREIVRKAKKPKNEMTISQEVWLEMSQGENYHIAHPGVMIEREGEKEIRKRITEKHRKIKYTLDRAELVMNHPELRVKPGDAAGLFKFPTMRFLKLCTDRWNALDNVDKTALEDLHRLECQIWRLDIDTFALREKCEVLLRDLNARYLPDLQKRVQAAQG